MNFDSPPFPPCRRCLAWPCRCSMLRSCAGTFDTAATKHRAAWSASARRWDCTRLLLPRKGRQGLRTRQPTSTSLKDFRNDFTVISGLSHAGMNPGFAPRASASFLTGVQGAGRPGFRNAISLDQLAAEHIGGQTRFPSLALSGEGAGISATRTGALGAGRDFAFPRFRPPVPGREARRGPGPVAPTEEGRSILDDVSEEAKKLQSGIGSGDRERLDEYLTSVRELEQRLAKDESWAKKPKPKVNVPPPTDIPNAADLIGRTKLLFDLTHLALQTDSTRLITIMLAGSTYAPPIPGVTLGHHDLSHHGKDPGKLDQLKIVEVETMKTLRDLLAKLKQSKEARASLLDRTTVFLGSNLGDGSSHSVKNLPVLVAGGGFKHGQHLAFDPQNPPPLCNLYVSMLQSLGIEVDRFGSSNGTLTGLEPK